MLLFYLLSKVQLGSSCLHECVLRLLVPSVVIRKPLLQVVFATNERRDSLDGLIPVFGIPAINVIVLYKRSPNESLAHICNSLISQLVLDNLRTSFIHPFTFNHLQTLWIPCTTEFLLVW